MKNCGSIKYIECRGEPYEMGRQYGKQASAEITQLLASPGYHWIGSKLQREKNFLARLKANLSKLLPEVYEELNGLADGAGHSPDAIILLNYYNNPVEIEEKCTPVGIVSDEDGVLIAKNNDGRRGEKELYPFVIRKSIPNSGSGMAMLQVTYAGWLSGLDAMNSAGVANTHASVGSVFPRCGSDPDIRLAACQAMRHSATAEDFERILREFPLAGKGFNILVGDEAGNASILEAAVPLLIKRPGNQRFLYATNHYVSERLSDCDRRTAEGKARSIYRWGYLKWLEGNNPPENINDLKTVLSSHAPWAPCRHGGAHQAETQWSMICDTGTKTLYLADNHPCRNEYQQFGF